LDVKRVGQRDPGEAELPLVAERAPAHAIEDAVAPQARRRPELVEHLAARRAELDAVGLLVGDRVDVLHPAQALVELVAGLLGRLAHEHGDDRTAADTEGAILRTDPNR